MVRRVSTILIFAALLFAMSTLSAFAARTPSENRVIDPASIRVMDYAFPDEQDFFVTSGQQETPMNRTGSGIGFGWTAGTTFYDYQHNSSMGRMINWGSSASCPWTIHLGWMMLPAAILADREVVYNGWDGSGGSAVGLYADMQNPGDYAGYGSLAVTDDNRFVLASHNNQGAGYRIHTFWQSGCNVPFHSPEVRVHDTLNDCGNTHLSTPSDAEVVWPKMAVQNSPSNGRILHLIGTAFAGGGGGSNFSYFRGEGAEGAGITWTFGCAIDTIWSGEGYDLASDESGNVAISWVANPPADGDPCDTCSVNGSLGTARDRWENDLYLQINRNYGIGTIGDPYSAGVNDWEPRVNITKHIEGTDGYRPFADMATMWDLAGLYHIAYVAMVWDDAAPGTYQSRIRHWQESYVANETDHRTVSTAQWDPNICNAGSFNQNQAKLSISECDNKFYVTWVELNSPMTTGNENHDDCADRAFTGDFTGAANGDLFVAISDDGGLTWDAPRGITDSYGGPTGDPNGACDPAGAGGPCPAEHWMSAAPQGSNFGVSLPTPSNVVDVSGSYGGNYYFDMSYIDDPEPGGAVFSYGAWYDADVNWIRVACVEPISAPNFAMTPSSYQFPSYVKHCANEVVNVLVENTGNAQLNVATSITEDPSAYSGWITRANFDGSVPSGVGNTVTGQIDMNAGATVCAAGTVVRLTGRVTYTTNVPVGTGIYDFEIDLVIADTVITPVWDSVATGCFLQLAVGNNGNMGNQGASGLGMDYSNDPAEWQPESYNTYMYDGGQWVSYVDAGGDTVGNWGLFQASIVDSISLLPQGGESHSTIDWADVYESGTYSTNDTSLSMTSKFYASTAYGCWIIKELKVAWNVSTLKSGAALPALTLGEVVDWDVPGDSTGTNNSSGFLTAGGYDVIYQQGIEMPGYDDSLEAADGGWDNDQRFGGIMYMGATVINDDDTLVVNTSANGMYTVDNSTYVYPFDLGLDAALTHELMSNGGSSLSDSIYDLHSGVSYVHNYDLAFGDTLVIFTCYATIMKDAARTVGDFTAIMDDAVIVYDDSLKLVQTCCVDPGDVNCDAAVDISDLTYTVDFMFRGGPPPCCYSSADVNGDGNTDISDLTYRVDFMFRGGPALICGTID